MNKEYKVIRIIDDKTLVINAGEKNKIKIGDKFKIYVEGVELIDLETKESYGKLETTKDIVTVVDVMDKMCICKKRIYTQQNIFDTINSRVNYTKIDDEFLNVEISQIENGLSDDLTIRINDKARLLNTKSTKD